MARRSSGDSRTIGRGTGIAARCLALVLACMAALACAGCMTDLYEYMDEVKAEVDGDTSDTDSGTSGSSSGSTASSAGEVLVDNDYVTIYFLDFEYDDYYDEYVVWLEIENCTDSTIMVYADYCTVDGLAFDPYWACSVDEGDLEETGIYIEDTAEFLEMGVEFTDLGLSFSAYDDDDWSVDDYFDDVCVHIYPQGEDAATTFVRETQSTDTVLVDDEYSTIVVTGDYYDDYLDEYVVCLYVVNKTDGELMVTVDDVTLNGEDCDPYWADTAMANTSCFMEIWWFAEELEEAGIDDPEDGVETMGLYLTVYDNDDYSIDNYIDYEYFEVDF